jgi:hypothetical protein
MAHVFTWLTALAHRLLLVHSELRAHFLSIILHAPNPEAFDSHTSPHSSGNIDWALVLPRIMTTALPTEGLVADPTLSPTAVLHALGLLSSPDLAAVSPSLVLFQHALAVSTVSQCDR